MVRFATAIIHQPEPVGNGFLVGEDELGEHIRRDADSFLRFRENPQILCPRRLPFAPIRGRQVIGEATASGAHVIGAVVEGKDSFVFAEIDEAQLVVAQERHELVEFVGLVVHVKHQVFEPDQVDRFPREPHGPPEMAGDFDGHDAAKDRLQSRRFRLCRFMVEAKFARPQFLEIFLEILQRRIPVKAYERTFLVCFLFDVDAEIPNPNLAMHAPEGLGYIIIANLRKIVQLVTKDLFEIPRPGVSALQLSIREQLLLQPSRHRFDQHQGFPRTKVVVSTPRTPALRHLRAGGKAHVLLGKLPQDVSVGLRDGCFRGIEFHTVCPFWYSFGARRSGSEQRIASYFRGNSHAYEDSGSDVAATPMSKRMAARPTVELHLTPLCKEHSKRFESGVRRSECDVARRDGVCPGRLFPWSR